ncbi:MAG: substrate-binding domain-containing protein, partial [Spirochaetota bacterium]
GAAEQHLRVPYDLSVVGFDDIQLASYAVPSLTTVQQQKQQIVAEAASLLLARISGEYEGSMQHRILTPRLVVRSSSGVPAGAHTQKERRASTAQGETA